DDAEADYFAGAARDEDHGVRSQRHAGRFGAETVIGYGHADDALVRILATDARSAALELTFAIAGERHSTSLPMLGSYNAHNAAAAVASAVELGIEPGAAMQRLRSFPGVPGRMQVVQHEPFLVVVDFAHTAPALDKALREVAHRARRLIVVIGAAGERD